MAAKPPKPPGNFLNQNNKSKNNSNNNNNNNSNFATTSSATSERKNNNNNSGNKSSKYINSCNNNSSNNNNNSSSTRGEHNVLEDNNNTFFSTESITSTPPRSACACTNISIMHLFHEMKQEFPTIPDPIVAQCVNENCHQRENCLQILRNELALNPIPVQTYPAKVLQQQQQQQRQQQQQHQQHQQQQHQKLLTQQSLEKPPKPLKPIRVAPSPLQAVNANANSNSNFNSNTSQLYAHLRGGQFPHPNPTSPLKRLQQQNSCDSVEELSNHLSDNININTSSTSSSSSRSNSCAKTKDVKNSIVGGIGIGECSTIPIPTTNTNLSDMPTTAPTNRVNYDHINNSNIVSVSENLIGNSAPPHHPPPPPLAPRARPTTLNIQSQKEIRQQLNVQLQQHFQQQQQQQQRQQPSASTATTPTTPPAAHQHQHQHQHQQQQQQQQQLQTQRPLRKAPLPPLPPKPIITSAGSANLNSPIHQYNNHLHQHQHQQTLNSNNNQHNHNETSSSASSQLTSPATSVAGESEISVNVASLLSSPATTPTTNTTPTIAQLPLQHANNSSYSTTATQQLKSPSAHIAHHRHRSVITVQPEPPYTRDFLAQSPTSSIASTSGCSSVAAGGQKSFTSVNLTLRQPNAALPHQSTIDISAGPGLGSGAGTGAGLTYSSTSYDARRGFQKNFQLTVTDEGGVFSASRIRPRGCVYPSGAGGEHEQDGPVGSITGNAGSSASSDGVSPLRAATSEQHVVQPQQYPTSPTQAPYYNYSQPSYQQQQQQQQQQQHNVASNTATQYRQSDDTAQIIERQKMRRDKLATALRDNKKRLNRVLQEIDVLKQPVSPGASERLDCEIQRLRGDCQSMLNEIENARRSGPGPSIVSWQDNKASTPTQQQQPFPSNRQRPMSSLSSSTSPRQPQLDFVQRHISTTTTTPTLNSPQNQFSSHPPPPPTYQQSIVDQQQLLLLQQQQQHQQIQPAAAGTPASLLPNDDEDYSEEEEVEWEVDPSEMWPCNMCTFRNHPQLNICECCENIRILPGTIRIVSTAGAGDVAAAAAAVVPTTVGAVGASSSASASATAAAVTPANSNSNANASIENDANLTQQQLQQFALHT